MIALQRCTACATWQYPARDACRACLSDALAPALHGGEGIALARAHVVATDTHVLTVLLDGGPHLLALGDAAPGVRVAVCETLGRLHAEPLS